MNNGTARSTVSHSSVDGGGTNNDKPQVVSYEAAAYVLGTRSLRHFLVLHAVLAGGLFVRDLQSSRAVAAGLHGLCLAAAAVLLLLQEYQLKPRAARNASLLLLVLLMVTAYASWAAALFVPGGSMALEIAELPLVQLSAFVLLVPTFALREVGMVMGGLTLLVPLLLLAVAGIPAAAGLAQSLVLRELIRGAIVNALGAAIAHTAEVLHRSNHGLVEKFTEESQQQIAGRRDMQRLLLTTLPAPVVREIAMKGGKAKCAHRYDEVTVLQADLVGFTQLTAIMGAGQMMGLLGELFKEFDEATEVHGVHKLKTIGDAYIVCCGAFGEGTDEEAGGGGLTSAPKASGQLAVAGQTDEERQKLAGQQHVTACRVVRMALAMIEITNARAKTLGHPLGVRIGVHTGKVVGGIIGTIRFHYDMWGPGVMGAGHMESHGEKGRVHMCAPPPLPPRLPPRLPPSFLPLSLHLACVHPQPNR